MWPFEICAVNHHNDCNCDKRINIAELYCFAVQRIGCFKEGSNTDRDLEYFLINGNPPITPTSCRDACRESQYPFAGTQVRYILFSRKKRGFRSGLQKRKKRKPQRREIKLVWT